MYEFDIKTLWKHIKAFKKRIFLNCVAAGVVAVVVGYSIPKEYSSGVELAAELQDQKMLGGGAASLASLAGIDLNRGNDAIGPNLYPNVMSSNEFLVKLLYTPVETVDGTFKGTYMDYLRTQQRVPWWSYPMQGLKKLKASLLSKKKTVKAEGDSIDPTRLSEDELLLVNAAKMLVQCSIDDEFGTISIWARSQDPLVAKMLVDAATVELQNFITKYRTSKACNDLAYYQQLERKAHDEYIAAQEQHAYFCDTHLDLTSQKFIAERERLSNSMELAYSAYSKTQQQVQLAQAKVQEKTPAFTVIQAAAVPIVPDSPRKVLILFAFMFLTFIGTLGWIYFRLLFSAASPAMQVNAGGAVTETKTEEKQ